MFRNMVDTFLKCSERSKLSNHAEFAEGYYIKSPRTLRSLREKVSTTFTANLNMPIIIKIVLRQNLKKCT